MAARSSSLAFKHWQRIIQSWPIDAVRPRTVSFQNLMQQRLSKPSSPSSPWWNEASEMRQVNALYLLLENRFATNHPMPSALRKPATDPEHYDVLLKELAAAPTRNWLGRWWAAFKGKMRIS